MESTSINDRDESVEEVPEPDEPTVSFDCFCKLTLFYLGNNFKANKLLVYN